MLEDEGELVAIIGTDTKTVSDADALDYFLAVSVLSEAYCAVRFPISGSFSGVQ
jgi:hypothetical protein